MIEAGHNIKCFRLAKKLSQRELAAQLNVSRQTISKWELNKSMPNTEYLVVLSKILAVSIDRLLSEVKEEEHKMKKALLVVNRYNEKKDSSWGYVATDYGTHDLVENISKRYPDYEWRPATLAIADELCQSETISLIKLVPIMAKYQEILQNTTEATIETIKGDEYVLISIPPFSVFDSRRS